MSEIVRGRNEIMCDEKMVEDVNVFLVGISEFLWWVFMVSIIVVVLVFMLFLLVNVVEVMEVDVSVFMFDGEVDSYFVYLVDGKYFGVIIWLDVLSFWFVFWVMVKWLV